MKRGGVNEDEEECVNNKQSGMNKVDFKISHK